MGIKLNAIGTSTWCALALTGGAYGDAVVWSASGADAAAISPLIDQFRAGISAGRINNGAGGVFGTGRREINWDAPGLDPFQSPNHMPADFFNNNSRRGARFATPDGEGFLVSIRNGDATTRTFADIEPSYANSFQTFSPARLFAVDGGVVTDTTFFLPGQNTQAATVTGFGVVFTDVDLAASTRIELFDEADNLLHSAFAPVSPDGGLSFLGVSFTGNERVFRARVTSGNAALGLGVVDGDGRDVVAMDDFLYSEPRAVPAPGTLVLCTLGLCGLRRRR